MKQNVIRPQDVEMYVMEFSTESWQYPRNLGTTFTQDFTDKAIEDKLMCIINNYKSGCLFYRLNVCILLVLYQTNKSIFNKKKYPKFSTNKTAFFKTLGTSSKYATII